MNLKTHDPTWVICGMGRSHQLPVDVVAFMKVQQAGGDLEGHSLKGQKVPGQEVRGHPI